MFHSLAQPRRGQSRDTFGDMGERLLIAAIPLVSVIAILLLGRPLRRRLFAGTGLAEWQATAQRLPWRDRIRLERANSRGRAATPELADLAVQRGRAMCAMIELAQTRLRMRRVFFALAGLMMLLVLFNVLLLMTGDGSAGVWLSLGLGIALAVLYAAMPAVQRRQLRKFRRSVELNEALLESPGDGA